MPTASKGSWSTTKMMSDLGQFLFWLTNKKICPNNTSVAFRLDLTGLKDGSFQVRLREAFPLVERFEVPYVVNDEPEMAEVQVQGQSKEGFTLINKEDNNKVLLNKTNLLGKDHYFIT